MQYVYFEREFCFSTISDNVEFRIPISKLVGQEENETDSVNQCIHYRNGTLQLLTNKIHKTLDFDFKSDVLHKINSFLTQMLKQCCNIVK